MQFSSLLLVKKLRIRKIGNEDILHVFDFCTSTEPPFIDPHSYLNLSGLVISIPTLTWIQTTLSK
jgi:hypothetical protein